MTDERVFTPYDPDTGDRYRMSLSNDDWVKIGRGGKWVAIVTDLNTGKRYATQGEPCNLNGCHCDASAVELLN